MMLTIPSPDCGYWAHKKLHGVDFSGHYLSDGIFERSDLSLCKFRKANLNFSYFYYSSLLYSDFRFALMIGAILDMADMAGADLQSADLRGASLMGTNLTDCKLGWALYNDGTQFSRKFDPEAHGMVKV